MNSLTNRDFDTIISISYEKGREKEEYVFRPRKREPSIGWERACGMRIQKVAFEPDI